MNTVDLKVPDILKWQYSDICEMSCIQQIFLNLAPEFIALLEASNQVKDWHEDDFALSDLRDARDRLMAKLGAL